MFLIVFLGRYPRQKQEKQKNSLQSSLEYSCVFAVFLLVFLGVFFLFAACVFLFVFAWLCCVFACCCLVFHVFVVFWCNLCLFLFGLLLFVIFCYVLLFFPMYLASGLWGAFGTRMQASQFFHYSGKLLVRNVQDTFAPRWFTTVQQKVAKHINKITKSKDK